MTRERKSVGKICKLRTELQARRVQALHRRTSHHHSAVCFDNGARAWIVPAASSVSVSAMLHLDCDLTIGTSRLRRLVRAAK
jgi:hypothetical protein